MLLIAARDIEAGEEITRDYAKAPRLVGDESEGSLRLLLQFGLPPKAWGGGGEGGEAESSSEAVDNGSQMDQNEAN